MSLSEALKGLRAFANEKFNLVGNQQFKDLFSQIRLPRLEALVQNIEAHPAPMTIDEESRKEWAAIRAGSSIALSRRSKRYLCWDPGVAATPEFVNYLTTSEVALSPSHLKGLVYACHQSWNALLPNTLQTVMALIQAYSGPNRVIRAWQGSLENLLDHEGPKRMSEVLVSKAMSPEDLCSSWGIAENTRYVHKIVELALEGCLRRMSTGPDAQGAAKILVYSLLAWDHIDISTFKQYLSKTILSDLFENDATVRSELTAIILKEPELGDPRLRPLNWETVDVAAKRRFIQLLSEEDIVFFFDHVMSRSETSQRRKRFWLQYVSQVQRSLPVLNALDQIRLKHIKRSGDVEFNFGEKTGGQSAFILDFGNVVVFEFNDVGACFMYAEPARTKVFGQVFTRGTYSDSYLKVQYLANMSPNARLVHNGDWEWKFVSQLAQYGIRR